MKFGITSDGNMQFNKGNRRVLWFVNTPGSLKNNNTDIYLIKSAMDIIFKFSACANWRSFGNLAMEPSSSTISHRTATGSNPPNTARSTEASVCPALFRTPPSLYFSGKIWPGRLKSSGFDSLDARAKIVVALSRAETPVVVPYFASYRIQ